MGYDVVNDLFQISTFSVLRAFADCFQHQIEMAASELDQLIDKRGILRHQHDILRPHPETPNQVIGLEG